MKSNHLVTLNPITDKTNLIQTIVHGFLLERTDHAIILELQKMPFATRTFCINAKTQWPKDRSFFKCKGIWCKRFCFRMDLCFNFQLSDTSIIDASSADACQLVYWQYCRFSRWILNGVNGSIAQNEYSQWFDVYFQNRFNCHRMTK